ncbi:hypothetical protein AYI69_g6884 [Smittium culicis]|uniref:Uncharacterized protein n=1 Tax=Smittium culicis TaxID=133412 RepID=A0A1R1XVU2_9FUNG|nr:hypothetical protein AYI69_g6884 [Smittium culicis]
MMDQEDPYVTTRIPLTDLAVYPELIEAFPSIEEDFFRTPLTEERKESARSCPKSSSMNYLPPPLNDSVYTADNPGLTTEDQHIVFSNKMRVLLADIDSLITQGRRDNLQKGMELPEDAGEERGLSRPHNKAHSRGTPRNVSICVDQTGEQEMNPKHCREGVPDPIQKTGIEQQGIRGEPKKSFCRAGPLGWPMFVQTWPSTTKRLEMFDEESAASPKSNSDGPPPLTHHPIRSKRKITPAADRILTDEVAALLFKKAIEETQTSPRLEEIESSCRTEEFQNGNADVDMEDGLEEELYDITRPRGCIHVYPNPQDLQEVSSILVERQILPAPRAPVWTVTQPRHFHQGLTTSSDMGSITGYAGLGVSRRTVNIRRIQGDMQNENQQNLIQAARAGVQNQGREIFDHAEESYHAFRNANQHAGHDAESSQPNFTEVLDELHRESASNVSGSSPWTPSVTKVARAKYHYAVIHPRKNRAGDIYILQRQCMRGGSWVNNLFRDMESAIGTDAHHCQGATVDLICATSQQGNRKISTYIHRKHNNPCICSEIWRHYIGEASGNRETDLDTLPTNQHSPAGNLHTVSTEPGRCSEPSNRANRMVNIRPNIHDAERYVRPPRRGSYCYQKEQEAESFLQLVSGYQGIRDQLAVGQLEWVEEPIRLPAMELNLESGSEGLTGTTDSNTYFSSMEISNMIPRTDEIINIPTDSASGDNNNFRPQNRKITVNRELTLESDSLADKRRVLQEQGFSDLAIEIFVSN